MKHQYFSATKGADFVINTKYVRKRIDFNLFDDVGHGHKIHATLFNMIPPGLERQSSIIGSGGNFENYKDFDTESFAGSEHSAKGSTLERRSLSLKTSNYTSIGRGGNTKIRKTAVPSNRFPTLPTAFPKAPSGTSFPMVPESPSASDTSRTPSEVYPDPISGEQGNNQMDKEYEYAVEGQSSFDLPLPPPPPPESPPPDFPPLDTDIDNQSGINQMQRQDTINMLPPPDFD